MSQLQNLLGNKVLRHQLGSSAALTQYRIDRHRAPSKARRATAAAEENRRLSEQQAFNRTQGERKRTKGGPSLLRRFLNAARKVFGGK